MFNKQDSESSNSNNFLNFADVGFDVTLVDCMSSKFLPTFLENEDKSSENNNNN